MATVNLGSIKFKWKGAYAGGTAYTVDDVVSYNGSSYICILASTGNLPTDTTYFEQMSAKGTDGTNGTDLGTTLTTQGDLVYRDGSGLQRLGAGTAGQVLQTGGAGANPSWTNLSSDYVKVASGSIGGVANFDLGTSLFDGSTYHTFDIILELKSNGTATSGNYDMQFSTDNGSSYLSNGLSWGYSHMNSGSSGAMSATCADNSSVWRVGADGFRNQEGMLKLTIQGLNRSVYKSGHWVYSRVNHDFTYRAIINHGGGTIDTNNGTNNSLRFYNANGHASYGNYWIYGYKS